MGFVSELIRDSLPIWQQCLDSDFVRGVADGSLPEDCFQGYIVDDSLYLREYAKVFAWGMLHAQDMAEIRNYYSLLSFVNESEDATRLAYLRRYHLTDEQIQRLPLRPENRAYADFMLDSAREGQGAPECMMACLPCMLSYGWIFRQVVKASPQVQSTPYWPFVRDYASDRYEAACSQWAAFTDEVCQDLSPRRREMCREIFRTCSLHELHFWEMSAKPRTDLGVDADSAEGRNHI